MFEYALALQYRADDVDALLAEADAFGPSSVSLDTLDELDPALLSDQQRVRAMVEAERLAAHAKYLVARFAAAIDSLDGPDDWALEEVSCALGVGSRTADDLLTVGRAISSRLVATGTALADGRTSYRHAVEIATRTARLSDDAAREVEAAVLPVAAEQTPAKFAKTVKAAVIAADPVEADRRARAAKAGSDIRLRPDEDSMAQLVIHGSAPEMLHAYNVLDALAGPGHPDDLRSVGERRVDAFLALIDGTAGTAPTATRHGRPVTVNVTMTQQTALGLADLPADLHGYGPIPPQLARTLAMQGTWRAWIADAATAQLRAVGTASYRPDQATSDVVLARDQECSFAFCTTPAALCDLDHIIPWPDGPTEPGNLTPASRRHHRAKHGPWKLTRHPDGTATWTSPLGFSYSTSPPPVPLDT